MTISYSNYDGILSTSAAILIASTPSQTFIITRITIENNDTVSHNVTLYRVQSGDSPSTSNIIVNPNNYPGLIASGGTNPLPLTGHSLVGGQSLYGAVDSGTSVNISISYTTIA